MIITKEKLDKLLNYLGLTKEQFESLDLTFQTAIGTDPLVHEALDWPYGEGVTTYPYPNFTKAWVELLQLNFYDWVDTLSLTDNKVSTRLSLVIAAFLGHSTVPFEMWQQSMISSIYKFMEVLKENDIQLNDEHTEELLQWNSDNNLGLNLDFINNY
jgi:hypothetical protein